MKVKVDFFLKRYALINKAELRLVVFFVLLQTVHFGQTQKIKVKKPLSTDPKVDSILSLPKPYSYLTFDIYYGFKSFKNSFYEQLNDMQNLDPSSPIKIIGCGISNYDFYYNPRGKVAFQMSLYSYQKGNIIAPDSISSSIKGFSYNFGVGKIIKTRNRKYSLATYLGFNTGRLKLSFGDGSTSVNPFFSPKLSIQPKIMLTRKIAISVVFDYEYDVSKTFWKNTGNSLIVKNYNQSGLVGVFSLGYCLK